MYVSPDVILETLLRVAQHVSPEPALISVNILYINTALCHGGFLILVNQHMLPEPSHATIRIPNFSGDSMHQHMFSEPFLILVKMLCINTRYQNHF